jgi:Ca2+/Na+ antiporter
VSIISDIFVESIEVITSQERDVVLTDPKTGKTRKHKVLVWNATVANLSLMALGTSAPEILLNVVEVSAAKTRSYLTECFGVPDHVGGGRH